MVVVFVRGVGQAEFVSRLRGVGGDRVLLVPVDVGKRSAMSMVANQLGEVVVDPFEFALDRSGVDLLLNRVAGAEEASDALVVRFGIEAAGHYHRTLTETLRSEAVELVELHPGAVHKARSEMGQRRLKSDIRDLAAMVEVMARGTGRSSRWVDGPAAVQAVWSAHRRRKVRARVTMGLQIQSQLDLVFPGLGDCFKDVIRAKGGHIILRYCPDPTRIRRMGPDGLRSYVRNRGVRMTRSKAALIVDTAQRALLLPEAERRSRMSVLKADVAVYDKITAEIDRADAELSGVIADTPAGVLTSLPGVAVPRASAYGAALVRATRALPGGRIAASSPKGTGDGTPRRPGSPRPAGSRGSFSCRCDDIRWTTSQVGPGHEREVPENGGGRSVPPKSTGKLTDPQADDTALPIEKSEPHLAVRQSSSSVQASSCRAKR